jgi:two-component system CheB/CheR fusion protein
MLLQSRHATMGEMIAMIAHQWRQPLSIIGMTTTNLKIQQELNDRVDKRELTEALENIDEQVAHASKTIDIFRDFYRQQHEKAFVDINEVVDQSLRLVQRMIEKYGIAITFERSEEPAELKLLDKELVQVLINLLNNAKDALIRSEHSPKQITVSVNDQGDKVAISVCDNGEGIPDAIVSRIFDAYFTTKEDDQGTGIGLYMSRMIVEQHLEGTLRLEQGENTCFVITLTRTSKAD